MRILVVDDDPGFRGIARSTLTAAGLEVVGEAETVAGARAAVQRLQPELVLLDVGLPDGNGVTLAHELSPLPWSPRIVLTSVDPDAVLKDQVRLSGARGFVPKSDLGRAGLALLLTAE